MRFRAWATRNRWALILLIPTFAVALAASSSRLVHFWWSWQPHEPTQAELGRMTTFEVPGGPSTMTTIVIGVLDVSRADQAVEDDGMPYEAQTPPGATWWQVTLRVEGGEPKEAACTLALADEEGHTVRYAPTSYPAPESFSTLPSAACSPAATFADNGTEEPAPQTYELRRYVLTSADFRPAEVRLWWATPTYLSVPLASTSS